MTTSALTSTMFVHNQSNGYIYNPSYITSGTPWPSNTPLAGKYGFIPLTNDYVIQITVVNGGTNYIEPIITAGVLWTAYLVVAAAQQVVYGVNLYTATTTFTTNTTPPTHTSGTVNNLTWAGLAAVITCVPQSGIIVGTNVTLVSGGSGYTTTPTVTITEGFSYGTAWAASGTATLGETVYYGGNVYTVTTAGTFDASLVNAPAFSSGSATNGTATLAWSGVRGNGATANATLNSFPQLSTGGLVPGVAYLDTYTVVGQPNGQIYTSAVNDPTSWYALDYLTCEIEPNTLVGLAKQLNYVVAFGQWSTIPFYDAASSALGTGSPLAPANSYSFEIGCANGESIAQMEMSVVWVGQSKNTGPAVYMLQGLSPTKVSTAYIERILSNSNLVTVSSFTFKYNGHMFYVLTLEDLNVTIVYDVGEKVWTQWTMWAIGDATSGVTGIYGEQYFRPSYYAGTYGATSIYYFLDDDNGTVYTMSDYNYTDAGAPIYYRAVTDITDSGTTKRKFYTRVEIVGDKVPAVMKIRHTDDDYNTWSPYRQVDLSKPRPQLYQAGQARRRAWEFLCTDAQPLRLDSAEIDFHIGEMENDGVQPTNYRT